MSDRPDPQERLDFFREKYAQPQTDVAREVERSVLGHAVGLSGYTTIEEADRLREVLQLSRTLRLLDLGAGRGWPGSHLASSSGCDLVSTDVPVGAMREARSNLARAGLRDRSEIAAAEGRALPFPAECFDAVVHADVFCWIPDKLSVLRECQRVLKPDGRVAGYVIHTPGDLTAGERRRAAELGPSEVVGPASPEDLARAAGLSIVGFEDVTPAFLATCEAIVRAREQRSAALRAAEGDEAYEEEQGKKESMRQGIHAGLLRRSLIIGRKGRSRTWRVRISR